MAELQITHSYTGPKGCYAAGGAAGSAAYLVGIFGPAFIEVVLARLRRGKAGDGDA